VLYPISLGVCVNVLYFSEISICIRITLIINFTQIFFRKCEVTNIRDDNDYIMASKQHDKTQMYFCKCKDFKIIVCFLCLHNVKLKSGIGCMFC